VAKSEWNLPEVYIQPGESHLVREPSVLRTVLGSCVGITFRFDRLGIAAMCHPMLPALPARKGETIGVEIGRRYVDFAVRDLARQFDALGVRPREAEVKLFGGADVLASAAQRASPTVGAMNSESALRVLRDEGFEVSASSLGGTSGIRLHFNTVTGEVLLQRLR